MKERILRAAFIRRLLLALVALVVAIGLPGCGHYDDLVAKDTNADAKWADVEAQLQRRHDLIPNLVATVKASAAHEEKTLAEVTQARANAASIKLTSEDLTDPKKMAAFEEAESKLKGSLSRLMVVQEKYPDLKANAAFHDLQVQLEGTENRLLRARETYNEACRDYNSTLAQVGGIVTNKLTGHPFKPRVYFKATAESQAAPEVKF
jgi:LemA protein